jgi:ribonuclease HII
MELIAGVDEAGRGPLAGPVVAAAVILDPKRRIRGLADSKVLTPERREELALKIRVRAVAWAIGRADVEEIDSINILRASLLAMSRAVAALSAVPQRVVVDGIHCPAVACAVSAIIGGDARVPAISAASIIAKVARDAEMCRLHIDYPQYGFHRHKGYSTPEHLEALRIHGPCPLHRRSFGPVAQAWLPGLEPVPG